MAREMINTQRVNSAGLTPTYTTMTVDGIEFSNTGNEIVHIKATTAAEITITTDATIDDGLTIEDRTISVGSGEEVFITGLDKRYYNTVDGTVYIDSDQTDTDIAILKK